MGSSKTTLNSDLEQLNTVIDRSSERLFRRQTADGRFSFFCEVSPWANAMGLIVLVLCGLERDPLVQGLQASLLRQQKSNGGWSLYPDQEFHLSASALAYFALLLSGVSRGANRMRLAESLIRSHGGITKASSLTKAFLAVAGQAPWSSLPDTHIELIFKRPDSILSLYDFSVPLRVHMPALMILSTLRYHIPVPKRCSLRHLIVPGESFAADHGVESNPRALKACDQFLLERQEADGTIAGYLSATSLFILSRMALGYDATDRHIRDALSGIRQLVYRAARAEQQMFTSDVWDTALSLQALTAVGLSAADFRMQRAARYLVSKQHQRVSDWVYHAPTARPGGWAFSRNNSLYPDLDDTAAAIMALLPFRGEGMFDRSLARGLEWAESMQNRNGGWGAFERNVNKPLLEWLTGADLPGVVTDPSAPDVTARVLHALARSAVAKKGVVNRGHAWLLREQQNDGSWRGRWGVSHLYGTFLAARSLRAVGVSANHSSIIRAKEWLEAVQHADGGFGESCKSDEQQRYIALASSLPSQTAWGLLALLATSDRLTETMRRAAQWLMSTFQQSRWKEAYPTGAGVAGEAYIRYHSYPLIWPLLALGEYRQRL